MEDKEGEGWKRKREMVGRKRRPGFEEKEGDDWKITNERVKEKE